MEVNQHSVYQCNEMSWHPKANFQNGKFIMFIVPEGKFSMFIAPEGKSAMFLAHESKSAMFLAPEGISAIFIAPKGKFCILDVAKEVVSPRSLLLIFTWPGFTSMTGQLQCILH